MRAGPGPGGRPQRDVRKPLARHASHGNEEAVDAQAGVLDGSATQGPTGQPATFAPQAYPPQTYPQTYPSQPDPYEAQAGYDVPLAHDVQGLPPVAPVPPGPVTTALPTALNYGAAPAVPAPVVPVVPVVPVPPVVAPRPETSVPAAYAPAADPYAQPEAPAVPFEPPYDDGYRIRSASADTGSLLLPTRRGRRDQGSHRTGPPKKGSAPVSALGAAVEVVVVVSLALVLAVVVKSFLVQAFYIPSESMEDTLLIGDRVLVSKLTPGPFSLHRGDVVVFQDSGKWLAPSPPPQEGAVRHALRSGLTFIGLLPESSDEHLIKRVIGLPGDTVKCCDVKGRLIVNGQAVDEPYLQPGVAPSEQKFTVTVPADRLWVMGDNRPFSADSRSHMNLPGGGTVPVSDVVGKAFVIVWPFSRAGGLGIPDTVFARVPSSSGGS